MNGSNRLGSSTQENLSGVLAHLLIAPLGMERAFVGLAQPARGPVQALGLSQPLGGRHRAIDGDLLGRRPIHGER